MKTYSITHVKGDGYLRHNFRDIISDNVDPARTKDNVILKRETLSEAYNKCFGKAVDDYNLKQKRPERRIDDYFYRLFGCAADDIKASRVLTGDRKTKSFYEDVLQVGCMDDCGFGSGNEDVAKQCLIDYFNGNEALNIPSYEERNPSFYVFAAVIHMDEATPHLQLDYIPVATGYKNGMAAQNGYNKALEEMGFSGPNCFADWRDKEREVFECICTHYGLTPKPKEKSRGESLTPDEYRKKMREADEKIREANALLNDAARIKQQAVAESEQILREAEEKLNELNLELEKSQKLRKRLEYLIVTCRSADLKAAIQSEYDEALSEAYDTSSEKSDESLSEIYDTSFSEESDDVTEENIPNDSNITSDSSESENIQCESEPKSEPEEELTSEDVNNVSEHDSTPQEEHSAETNQNTSNGKSSLSSKKAEYDKRYSVCYTMADKLKLAMSMLKRGEITNDDIGDVMHGDWDPEK